MQYFLPCECGQKTAVATSQAGETIVCACGRSLVVPKLRGLLQLEPYVPEATKPRGASWSPLQGSLFVAGTVLLIVSALSLAFTSMQRRYLVTERPESDPAWLEEQLATVDTHSPVENLEIWQHEILEHGPDRPGEPAYLVHRRVDEMLATRLAILSATAALGAALIGAAFILRPRSK
jgi:hypothetical protein